MYPGYDQQGRISDSDIKDWVEVGGKVTPVLLTNKLHEIDEWKSFKGNVLKNDSFEL